MQEPYLFISVFDEALHIGKKLPSESKPRELFEIACTDICSDGLDVASNKLGSTILGILKLWHAEPLAALGESSSQSNRASAAAFEAALLLIEKFAAGAPEICLKLVDELLADAAVNDALAREYWHTDWPPLRRRLLAKSDS
jgi:hypothetical protein